MVLVLFAEGSRNAEAGRSGLAGNSTTLDVDPDVVGIAGLGRRQRLDRSATSVRSHEEGLNLLTVDNELAGAGLDTDASGGRLATAGAPDVRVVDYHVL